MGKEHSKTSNHINQPLHLRSRLNDNSAFSQSVDANNLAFAACQRQCLSEWSSDCRKAFTYKRRQRCPRKWVSAR
jgi:hypothetical protein